ncbi:hypothetical protein RvY_03598-2 [Ramazzottius varieornatus]|uniref:Uncharacterized protein n=1 Tax=Ramazzottius varieornatus TaxID=947166 RepID=A0A1D1UY10_RAMVA|nr:hypothetical protein RvY_03598-2 [Ramazzottius varieornatus]
MMSDGFLSGTLCQPSTLKPCATWKAISSNWIAFSSGALFQYGKPKARAKENKCCRAPLPRCDMSKSIRLNIRLQVSAIRCEPKRYVPIVGPSKSSLPHGSSQCAIPCLG